MQGADQHTRRSLGFSSIASNSQNDIQCINVPSRTRLLQKHWTCVSCSCSLVRLSQEHYLVKFRKIFGYRLKWLGELFNLCYILYVMKVFELGMQVI